ncbi:LOB domain-containing protein 2 [Malania oleifera]|uniref:LOB domain-containing protein 2 n=1 Tax=Malania oleifera TaxID=397392 RepID=UPI0025ADFE57|nr:LOB domain-containing protein 2 [Malania oleifera]
MQRNSNGTAGAHPACAACKHQRKKCDDKCILAPFFPADKTQEFQAVHKVFGVSNVQKIVKSLPRDEDRRRAADSLVWEAFCRQRDPVLGSYGEYRRVYDELKLYKSQYCQSLQNIPAVAAAAQGGLVYKAPPTGFVGWNGKSGMINKGLTGGVCGGVLNSSIANGLSYIQNTGTNNALVDSTALYDLASQEMQEKEMREERDVHGSLVIPVPQQHSINGFNSHLYLSGN